MEIPPMPIPIAVPIVGGFIAVIGTALALRKKKIPTQVVAAAVQPVQSATQFNPAPGPAAASAAAVSAALTPNTARNPAAAPVADVIAAVSAGLRSPETAPGVPGFEVSTVRGIQDALENLGFPPGPIDGIMGAKTKSAIIAFQKSRGLAVDGIVGNNTRTALINALVEAGLM